MGGSLTEEEVGTIQQDSRKYKFFVETGTYQGDTTMLASRFFDHVYTTEIHQGLYESSQERARSEGVTNITFLCGDSIQLLKEIVPQVLVGSVYFLDAHISGHDSGWNGCNRVPLFEELDVILSHKNMGPSLFIIDDIRLYKTQVWDWAHITTHEILRKFEASGYKVLNYYEHNDRLYVSI